ncbi:hypothetical protein R1sor_020211 [Riccia sorocarpa]|uniref:HVA22-like protein n=1 Tax=Riccia sorocarpa TaxID=122646 RepID=A0ABD3IGD1_9MARC
MVGSLITRAVIMVLGYLYPAYECFKTVEKNRPDMEHLRFWCQYWMIIALVTVMERLGDALISWLPMYSEAKLFFIIYLWYPKTRGTTYIYATFVRPFVAQHEPEIDRNLNELRTRAGDWAFLYWQRGSTYFQTRFVELLQYLAAQSPRAQAHPAMRYVYPQGVHHSASVGPRPGPGGSSRAPPPPPSTGPVPAGPIPGSMGPIPPSMAPVPGNLRQRAVIIEEDDDYDLVDSHEPSVPPYLPEESVGGAGGYMTRSRQRTASTRAANRSVQAPPLSSKAKTVAYTS